MPAAWRGSLTFGLVSVAIRLYPAARASRVRLHQLHRVCHTRLQQPLFCPTCNRVVGHTEIVKGYEYEEGKYVLLDENDIRKITPESARSMEILAFVKESEIDPLFFHSSYFAVPEPEGRKGYELLLKTLVEAQRVGIAKATMHQREYTVFIRPYKHGLTLHTMYFANEIRQAPGYGQIGEIEFKPREIKLARQLVETLSEKFHLEKYHDEFQTRLNDLMEARRKGKEIAAVRHPHRAPVIDMMAALERSLNASNRGEPSDARKHVRERRGPRRVAS
jgi:DNA end-binding protein Ku